MKFLPLAKRSGNTFGGCTYVCLSVCNTVTFESIDFWYVMQYTLAYQTHSVSFLLQFVLGISTDCLNYIRCRLRAFYCWYVNTLRCDLELWPRDLDLWPLTLNICSVPAVLWPNSVPNLSEIGQSAAELLQFEYLTLWPWTCITCYTML